MWRPKEPREPRRVALLTRPIVSLVLTAFGAVVGFFLLLSVVPLYTDEAGGGSSGAGLATGAFMLSTVLTQIQMPRILRWLGYGWTLAAGLLFLGLPSFLYLSVQEVAPIISVTLLRGVGFGIVTVVFAALLVKLSPASRRGEALGLLGVALTLPTIFCNPLGLWLVDRFDYSVVFAAGGLTPLLGLIAIPVIRRSTSGEEGFRESKAGIFVAVRRGPLLRIALLFTATTMASGVVLTFLPLAVSGSGLFSAGGALLIYGVTLTVARWWAGRFCDRRDPRLLLVPGLVTCSAGMVCLPFGGPAMLVGAVLFGAGFGLLQNTTLILTMKRVSDSEHAMGSTLWNAAFDAGTGLGAFLFGFIIPLTGFFWAFTLSAGLVASSLILVYFDRQLPAKYPS